MESLRSIQHQRLKHLSINAQKAEDAIVEKLKTAESILKTFKMSQGLETEKEQILPFCTSLSELYVENAQQMPEENAIIEAEASEEEPHHSEQKAVKVMPIVGRILCRFIVAFGSTMTACSRRKHSTKEDPHTQHQPYIQTEPKWKDPIVSVTFSRNTTRLELQMRMAMALDATNAPVGCGQHCSHPTGEIRSYRGKQKTTSRSQALSQWTVRQFRSTG